MLKETLDLLKTKWRTEGNYAYICDQFKSMRQDLTVQRIKNDFTVSVYEIHARIALEKVRLPILSRRYPYETWVHRVTWASTISVNQCYGSYISTG